MKKSSVKKLNECVRRLSKIEKKYQKVFRETGLVVDLLQQVERDLGSNLGKWPKIDVGSADYAHLTQVYGVAEPLTEIVEKMRIFDLGTMIDTLRQIAGNGPSEGAPATTLPGNPDSATGGPFLGGLRGSVKLTLGMDTTEAQKTLARAAESIGAMQVVGTIRETSAAGDLAVTDFIATYPETTGLPQPEFISPEQARREAGMGCEDEGCPHYGQPHGHIESTFPLSRVPDREFVHDYDEDFYSLAQKRKPHIFPGTTLTILEPDWRNTDDLPHSVRVACHKLATWFIAEDIDNAKLPARFKFDFNVEMIDGMVVVNRIAAGRVLCSLQSLNTTLKESE